MALLGSRFAVHVFVTIVILINILHGYRNEEESKKCLQHVNDAFGNCESANECLKYAIEHYIKDDDTPASTSSSTESYDNLQAFIEADAYMNYLSSEGAEQDGPVVYFQDSVKQLLGWKEVTTQQISNHAKDFRRILATTENGTDYATLYHERLEPMISGEGPIIYVQSSIQQSLSAQKGTSMNDQNSDQQIFDGLEDLNNIEIPYVQSSGPIMNVTLDDLNKNLSFDAHSSDYTVTPQQISNHAKFFHRALETAKNGTDYATLYHKKLETMITARGVPNRKDFCKKYFFPPLADPKECMNVLYQFGNSAISAVKWAFKRYTIKECLFLRIYYPHYAYITLYMQVIIGLCQANAPKKPIIFCENTVKKLIELYVQNHGN